MEKAPKIKFSTVDEYIAGFPPEIKKQLEELRGAIKKAAPQAQEIISYNMPSYKQEGFVVSFAAWKKHIGMYPIPAGDAAFRKEIAAYKAEKNTIQFPLDKPLPISLIAQIVKLRVVENLAKAAIKGK